MQKTKNRKTKVNPITDYTDYAILFEKYKHYDADIEAAVIAAIYLFSNNGIQRVRHLLAPDMFYYTFHQQVFKCMVEMFDAGIPIDLLTVRNYIVNKPEVVDLLKPFAHDWVLELARLSNHVVSDVHLEYHAGIVREQFIERKLIMLTSAGLGGVRASEKIFQIQKEIDDLMQLRVSDHDWKHISEVLISLYKWMAEVEGKDIVGVPTGFPRLDKMLSGITQGLYYLAARPGVGKTAIALKWILNHGAMDVPVGIISLEMPDTQLGARVLSMASSVEFRRIYRNKMQEGTKKEVYASAQALADFPIYISDNIGVNLPDIRAKVMKLIHKHKCQIVYIDYLQLVETDKTLGTREQEVAALSRGLKLLSLQTGIPIVCLAQLSRESEKKHGEKKPALINLRESGCLTADTTLLRADTGAPISFSDLMKHYKGISVWSLDDKNKLKAAPITNVFYSGEKEVFRMTLASGRTIKASANHKFLTFDGWRELGGLLVGNRIAIPRRTLAPWHAGLGWSEEQLGLLAHMIGDGCSIKRQPVHYTSTDEENLRFVEKAAGIFGIKPRRVKQDNWWHVYLPKQPSSLRNPINLWFAKLGIEGLRSYEKKIPEPIFGASDEEISIFLRHLWSTDGRVAEPSSMKSGIPEVSYSTTSRELADGVLILLSRFDIIATVSKFTKQEYRPLYRVVIQNSRSILKFCNSIGVYGSRGLRVEKMKIELKDKITNTNNDTVPISVWKLVEKERYQAKMTGRVFQAAIDTNYCGTSLFKSCPSRDRLNRIANVLKSDTLSEIAGNDIFWDRIVSVESLGVQPVYDATVAGTHNFIADGIIAHNSLEQDADGVILLHRDWASGIKTVDGMSTENEADFIMAKNRNGKTFEYKLHFNGKTMEYSEPEEEKKYFQ